MNELEKEIIKEYKKSIMYKISILYIIFGLFIFSINRSEYAYFELLNYSTNHPFVVSLFLLPTISCTIIYIETKYFNNYNIFIRLGRKKAIKSNLKIIFHIINNLFIILIMSSLILTNIFANRNYYINNDLYYDIPNVIAIIINLFKTYLFALTIGILSSVLANKKIYITISILLVIMISFMGIIPTKFLIIFPSYYISNYHIFQSINENILYSSIYIITTFSLVFSAYLLKWRKDLI